jgi:hypothetical protein
MSRSDPSPLSLIKIFFPFTKTEGEKKKEVRNSIDASLLIGHDGYLWRAVCIKANQKRSEKKERVVAK